jgi:hypothetical protein
MSNDVYLICLEMEMTCSIGQEKKKGNTCHSILEHQMGITITETVVLKLKNSLISNRCCC